MFVFYLFRNFEEIKEEAYTFVRAEERIVHLRVFIRGIDKFGEEKKLIKIRRGIDKFGEEKELIKIRKWRN